MYETQIIQLSPLCLSSDIDLARSLSGLFFANLFLYVSMALQMIFFRETQLPPRYLASD